MTFDGNWKIDRNDNYEKFMQEMGEWNPTNLIKWWRWNSMFWNIWNTVKQSKSFITIATLCVLSLVTWLHPDKSFLWLLRANWTYSNMTLDRNKRGEEEAGCSWQPQGKHRTGWRHISCRREQQIPQSENRLHPGCYLWVQPCRWNRTISKSKCLFPLLHLKIFEFDSNNIHFCNFV